MNRYMSEARQSSLKGKSLSLANQIGSHREKTQQAGQLLNSSIALRELKKINQERETIKGRLTIIQAQEEKNEFKAFLSQQKLQFHLQMRNQLEKSRHEKALHQHNVLVKIQEAKEQALNERINHKKNLNKAKKKIKDLKVSDYLSEKQRTKDFKQSIVLSKSIEDHKKKERNREIRQYERSQREKVQEYHKQKVQGFHHKDSSDSLKLQGLKEESMKQISELSRLQAMMLERHSRSKMISDQNQRRLKQMLGGKKALSTSQTHNTKLPSLNPEKRNSQHNILVGM